jgi:enterochelin esterase-like enzyme
MASCQFGKKMNVESYSESKIVVDTIFSENLNENRLLSIYLPKDYVKTRTYPVVYAADGQIVVQAYKKMLDSLIENKTIPEVILIGIHSNEKKVPGNIFEYRNYEYIKGFASSEDTIFGKRYINHYNFFTQEVIKYAESKYNVSTLNKDRIFYGTSNGAGLGVSIGAVNPVLFKNYICFSIAGEDYEDVNWTKTNYPYFYLSYGDKESESFIIGAKDFVEFLSVNNYNHESSIYEGGHDRKMWRKEFFRVLPKILAKTSDTQHS